MKYIFRSFVFVFFCLTLSSCLNNDDELGGSYHNSIAYDGFRTRLNYARVDLIKTEPFGEIYQLALYENYRPIGWTDSQAVLYLEFYKPYGYPFEGVYNKGSTTGNILDYATYFEGAVLFNGKVNSAKFRLDDANFRTGYLRIRDLFSNRGSFDVQLVTHNGRSVEATYYGYFN